MAKGFTEEDDALLGELGVEVDAKKTATRTPREERILAGFEEIRRFADSHGRPPGHAADDIFERLYAVRLDRIRASDECRAVLAEAEADPAGLLNADAVKEAGPAYDADESDDDLLDALGVEAAGLEDLRHVRTRAEVRAAEDIARREPCPDFEGLRPRFDAVQAELDAGTRKTARYGENPKVEPGDWFIVDGQKALVVAAGEAYERAKGDLDRRLRVVYDNGTQSNLLLRSLQKALSGDPAGRRILASDLDTPALFQGEEPAGRVYVLRSGSDAPFVAEHRDLLHKIGVTRGSVSKRIAGAADDPTYLLAPVEVVGSFALFGIDAGGAEKLLHRFFADARLDASLPDRFGRAVEPREWFLVPLEVIREAVTLLGSGQLAGKRYDPEAAAIVDAGRSPGP